MHLLSLPSLSRRLAVLALVLASVAPAAAQTPSPYVLAELQAPTQQNSGYFGWATAGVDDTDGDGRGDFLVGAFGQSPVPGLERAGRAYLFSGADRSLRFTLVSPNEQDGGLFGSAVAGVPDVNGDGRGDLLVGAYVETTGSSPAGAGRAYLFSGANGALLRTLVSPNEEFAGYFGGDVAGVPDVDGDGRGDLLVGAYSEDPGGRPDGAGQAHLFSGATGALLRTLASPDPKALGLFGISVAGVRDVNGDGFGDLLIGAEREDPGTSPVFAGRAYLFSGATGTLIHTLVSPNEETQGYFGSSVAAVPDADGDGDDDLLVGAYREDLGPTAAGAGRAYLFSGDTGTLIRTLVSPNEEVEGYFGLSVSGISDVDGDGRGDLLVGAVLENPRGAPRDAGRAYLFSGDDGALLSVYSSPKQERDGFFGFSVAGVPDTNGDGRGDVLTGAYFEDPGTAPTDAGRAYLYAGGPLPAVFEVEAEVDGPVSIPSGGGSFTFEVRLENATGQTQAVDAWASVLLPNGSVLGPLVGPRRIVLPGGANVGPVTLQQRVPAAAPGGSYTYVVQTGQFPLAASTSSFPVTKAIGSISAASRMAQGDTEWTVVELTTGTPVLAETAAPPVMATGETEWVRSEADGAALGAYPNPFQRQTTLTFALDAAGPVRLAVYDVTGREVAVLVDEVRPAGSHAAPFAADGLPSGVYVYRLTAGTQVQTGRLTLVR